MATFIDTTLFTGTSLNVPIDPAYALPENDTSQWASKVVEKVRAAVAGGLRFLPRLDVYTEETPEIREAYRMMLREPVLKSAHKTKVEAVAQLDLRVTPVSDDPRDIEIAEFCKYSARKVKGGTVGIARNVLGGGLLDGFSVCNKVFMQEDKGRWRGKSRWRFLKGKDTKNLSLSTDEFRNVTAVVPLAFGIGEEFPPDQFVIYSYGSLFESVLGTSDHRAAYGSFWFKDAIKKLWGLHLDKYVSPLLKGTYFSNDQKAALEQALEQARSDTWLTVPQGVMIEAVQLATRGEAEFEAACDYQDRQMLIATAGAYLQTLEGKIADGRGDTSIHKDAAALFQWGLAADLTTIYNEQLLPELVEMNYAGADVPEAALGSISDGELKASLAIDEGLQGMGFRHSRKGVAKFYGREEATDPVDLLTPGGDALPQAQPLPLGGPAAVVPPGGPADMASLAIFEEGESYFATCDRDEEGHCLPGGGGKETGKGKDRAAAIPGKAGLMARAAAGAAAKGKAIGAAVLRELKPSSILARIKQGVAAVTHPIETTKAAGAFAKGKFDSLRARYGIPGAIAIGGAYAAYYTVAVMNPVMFTIPVPLTPTILTSARVLRYGILLARGKPVEFAETTEPDLLAEAKKFIAELAVEYGDPVPELDDDILAQAMAGLLDNAGE